MLKACSNLCFLLISLTGTCIFADTGSVQTIEYKVSGVKEDWLTAYLKCLQNGMELASITTTEEEKAIEKALDAKHNEAVGFGGGSGYWIAGKRIGTGSPFWWYNSGKPLIYGNFANSQPDDAGGGEWCVEIFKHKNGPWQWNDYQCGIKRPFVCQTREIQCNTNGSMYDFDIDVRTA